MGGTDGDTAAISGPAAEPPGRPGATPPDAVPSPGPGATPPGPDAAAPTGAADGPKSGPSTPRGRRPVVAALMLGMALAAIDGTIVSTAVPQIVGDLGGFAVFSWLFSGYLLAVTVTLPVYGKLSDTFGRKPVLVAGIILFLVGSVLCAAAWNMAALIAFRVVQGLGGGALQGTVQTIAADLYPLKERPRIQAKLSTVWATSAVAGPAVGGLLAAYADWRWIFLINLPVGGLALWLVVRHLHEPSRPRPATRPRIDWAGALAVFATGAVLLTALVQGGVAWPWLSAPSLALFGAGAALAALTVAVERRAADPIIPGWVWRRRTIASVNLALGAMGLLMVAPTVFLPTYAQAVLGLGPIAAGFVLSVMTLSWPVSAALSNRVYHRIGFRLTAIIGMSAALLILLAFPLLPYPGAALAARTDHAAARRGPRAVPAPADRGRPVDRRLVGTRYDDGVRPLLPAGGPEHRGGTVRRRRQRGAGLPADRHLRSRAVGRPGRGLARPGRTGIALRGCDGPSAPGCRRGGRPCLSRRRRSGRARPARTRPSRPAPLPDPRRRRGKRPLGNQEVDNLPSAKGI
ncbi:multidrug resistance protein [Streptomyces sp. TE33382]